MYLNPREIKALRATLHKVSRVSGRKTIATRKLERALAKNETRIMQQRKIINNMMQMPTMTMKKDNHF